jgi:hypothetical protein
MNAKGLNELISQIETHIECWKQFNHFLEIARAKKFGPVDENQFLEIKSIIAQELEMIFSSIEVQSPAKDEVIALVTRAPSLRYLAETGAGEMRGIESNWHKIYIGWHAILGQLKVKQRAETSKAFWGNK